MIEVLAVLISFPCVSCTPYTVQEIFNGVYFVFDAVAILLSIPYMFYTPSMSEKISNGEISCGRCFSRSQRYSLCGIYTFYE